MSRSGYTDDCDDTWEMIRWAGILKSARRGKRGQAFFRELVAALDAMPEKRLVEGALETEEGAVCALGCLGRAKGVRLAELSPKPDEFGDEEWDHDALGAAFNVAPSLAREVMYRNDDYFGGTPEQRWEKVRDWAARQIIPTEEELVTP